MIQQGCEFGSPDEREGVATGESRRCGNPISQKVQPTAQAGKLKRWHGQ
jgi:hypothetical protein